MRVRQSYNGCMAKTLIGYARCSTDKQDLASQQAALVELGVSPDRIYTDRGLTGTSRERPGLDQALAAVRAGDTLVVPKLDRLARSVPDARDIADSLVKRGVRLALGSSVYDPSDPMGKMFFNVLATFAEFEADLFACARERAWRSREPRANFAARCPSCQRSNNANCGVCTTAATTRLATSRSCSQSPGRPFTGRLPGRQAPNSSEDLRHLSLKVTG